MPNIIATKQALLEPILYEGHPYFTAQYFHQQYIENSPHGGKYRRYPDFARMLRSIETYQEYLTSGDVTELSWSQVKTGPKPILLCLEPLFHATGYQPLTLLNATAQAALTHHLDDEISRKLSVAINTHAARGSTSPLVLAQQDMQAWKELAALFEAPLHIALQEGVKYVEKTHGVDLRPLLLASPSQNDIPDDAMMLEPTELAQRLGYRSGIAMNKALEALGWQEKQAGAWEPTDAGAAHSTRHAWINGGKSGYNTKWRLSSVRSALQQAI